VQQKGWHIQNEPTEHMNIIVTAGLSDYKLSTKLIGLVYNNSVNKIFLVRKTPLNGPTKIQNINPSLEFLKIFPLYEIWRLYTLLSLSRKNNITAIIGIQLIIHGIQVRIAGWLSKKPVVLSLIGKDVHMYLVNHWTSPLLKYFVKRMDCVTVMGNRSKNIVSNAGIPAERIFLLQNYQDPQRFNFLNANKEWDIIYIGQLIPRKRVNDLICAIHLVGHNLRFIIVGSGPELNNLKTLVNKLNLTNNVDFIGDVHNVESYLNQTRLLVLSSNMEALPAVAIESMYCGTPAVLPDICDIPSYFGHGKESLLCCPGDIDDIAKKIEKMLFDESVYTEKVDACLEWARKHMHDWSKEKQVHIWTQILTTCINKKTYLT